LKNGSEKKKQNKTTKAYGNLEVEYPSSCVNAKDFWGVGHASNIEVFKARCHTKILQKQQTTNKQQAKR